MSTDTGYDPYDSTSTRNRMLETVSIPTLVELPDEQPAAPVRETDLPLLRMSVRQALAVVAP